MRKLIRGLLDFQLNTRSNYRERFALLAQGQKPDCLFIACADSRVVPNLLVSTNPGDLFVVRNVGNMMPPSDPKGNAKGDQSEAAALEFSLRNLPVEDIVVCGHSSCGAMKAVLGGGVGPENPNLNGWLEHGKPALQRMKDNPKLGEGLPDYDRLSQHNVLLQMEHIASYPWVKERLDAGSLRLHGWWFDIGTAQVHTWRPSLGRFIPMDELVGEALLRELGTEGPAHAALSNGNGAPHLSVAASGQ
ncbi:carbonic anhydrase [Myxococcus sp. Y35]|uniref:carbonic anhydrase n=1 Tax=Pseudomyxococcus flavus TaxID=3115648 RepID=UPI003CF1BAD7